MRFKLLMTVALLAGCAELRTLTPPEPAAAEEHLQALERTRAAFERGDRLGVLAEVDADFEPSLNRLEQALIDAFLRYGRIRLEFASAERSHGAERIGVRVRWARSWASQATNAVETKEGEAVLVLRERDGAWKLVRVDGESPFEP